MSWSSVEILSLRRSTGFNGWQGTLVAKVAAGDLAGFASAHAADAFPSDGGEGFLVPLSFDAEPFDPNIKQNADGSPEAWKVTVQFGPRYDLDVPWPDGITKPDHLAGTSLKIRMRLSGQAFMFPRGAVRAKKASPGDPDYPPNAGGSTASDCMMIPLTDYYVDWDYVPSGSVKAAEWRSLVGHVNSVAFLGCDPGTLLCEGADLDHSFVIAASSMHAFKVTANFKERRIEVAGAVYGWNHSYYANPPGWRVSEIAQDGGTHSPPYPEADFTNIFNPTT